MGKNTKITNKIPANTMTAADRKICEAAITLRDAIQLYKDPSLILRPRKESGYLEEYGFLLHEARKNFALYLEYSDIFGALSRSSKEQGDYTTFMIDDFMVFEEQLRQDRKDLANKIVDFFIAVGKGEITSFHEYITRYPVVHFNDREGSAWAALYKKFAIEREPKVQDRVWARVYQLLGVDNNKVFRATSAIREMVEIALRNIASDEDGIYGVPIEKINSVKIYAMENEICKPNSETLKKLIPFACERNASSKLLSGDLLDVLSDDTLSDEKVSALAQDRASRLSNAAYSVGIRECMAATSSEYEGIIRYMYDNNIPLVEPVLQGLIRDYLLGNFKLPEEYAKYERQNGEVQTIHSSEGRTTIEGTNNGNSRVPRKVFPDYKEWRSNGLRPNGIEC